MVHVTSPSLQHDICQRDRRMWPVRGLLVLGCLEVVGMERHVTECRIIFAFSVMNWKKAFPSFFPARVSRKNLPSHLHHPPPPQHGEHPDRHDDPGHDWAPHGVSDGSNNDGIHGFHGHTYMVLDRAERSRNIYNGERGRSEAPDKLNIGQAWPLLVLE